MFHQMTSFLPGTGHVLPFVVQIIGTATIAKPLQQMRMFLYSKTQR